jgi:predicted short-subunit dehydrogenase-like oxidoreductase (DUF2520 family)
MSSIAIIGTGRLGATLALAFDRVGLDVVAVASRSAPAAAELAGALRACRATSCEAAAQAELVFLTVPDDSIAALAARLPWRDGQSVVHCSGATEVSVLAPAGHRGAAIGGFHPLQIFSDPQQAIGLLPGSSVAIEGPPALEAQLRDIAERLRMRPIVLPPGARALYHGGASFAASFLLSMLHEAVAVWARFGVSEHDTLQALMPLAEGTLAAAARRGLAGALAGPVSRGDAGVVQRHLAALEGLGGEHADFYRAMTRRQLLLARESGRLDEPTLAALAAVIAVRRL